MDTRVYEGKIAVIGAMYDVSTGDIEYLTAQGVNIAENAVVDAAKVTEASPQS